MITAGSRTGLGEPLLFLGLSGENVTRLTAGEPVMIPSSRLRELGLPPMVVVIHYGRTEQDIRDEVTAHGVAMQPPPDAGP